MKAAEQIQCLFGRLISSQRREHAAITQAVRSRRFESARNRVEEHGQFQALPLRGGDDDLGVDHPVLRQLPGKVLRLQWDGAAVHASPHHQPTSLVQPLQQHGE